MYEFEKLIFDNNSINNENILLNKLRQHENSIEKSKGNYFDILVNLYLKSYLSHNEDSYTILKSNEVISFNEWSYIEKTMIEHMEGVSFKEFEKDIFNIFKIDQTNSNEESCFMESDTIYKSNEGIKFFNLLKQFNYVIQAEDDNEREAKYKKTERDKQIVLIETKLNLTSININSIVFKLPKILYYLEYLKNINPDYNITFLIIYDGKEITDFPNIANAADLIKREKEKKKELSSRNIDKKENVLYFTNKNKYKNRINNINSDDTIFNKLIMLFNIFNITLGIMYFQNILRNNESDNLKKDNEEFKSEIEKLKRDNEKFKRDNENLRKEFEKLKKQIEMKS